MDSPKLQTLVLLSCVALLTVVLWSSAKLACNSKTASARPPLRLETSEITKDPKNAAFELQHRWAMHDYSRVRTLAKGQVLAELNEAARRCESDSSCEREREELRNRVKSTATLLESSPTAARVRVKTVGVEGGQQTYMIELVQEDGKWKATSRKPEG